VRTIHVPNPSDEFSASQVAENLLHFRRLVRTLLKEPTCSISMDGKGRWVDNVFVERLWRSVKYEHVYLHAYDSVSEAKQQLARYFEFYNTARPHSSLGGQTPNTAYCGNGEWKHAA
jgi:putative transposase